MSYAGKALGQQGEELACAHLMQKGYRILRRNFSGANRAELDIIAQDGDTTVFVEVKTFAGNQLDESPAANVNLPKQRKVISAARQYLAMIDREPLCRFDVVAVTLKEEAVIEHFVGAFTA